MSLHFTIEFEDVEPSGFYQDVGSNTIDEEFADTVKEELDEDFSIVETYSENSVPPYVVFRANFESTHRELYEKYGRSGLTEKVADIAEDVYGWKCSQMYMERW